MGNDNSALRQVFEELDRDQSGTLSLTELLSLEKVPGVHHPIHNSPLLLYRFDASHTGAINFDEFVKMLQAFRDTERRVMKNMKNQASRGKVWCSVKRDTAADQYDLTRDSETPAFTGRVPQEHDSDKESSDSDKEEKDSSSSDNTEVGFEIEKELREEAQEYLLEQILSESGRKKFLRWLFKVADSTHDGTVSVSELTQLIKALRLDGILPEALCFAPDRCKSMVGSPDERLAKELIREYDYENSGSLSQDEFEALGELILKNYQIRQETPSENMVGPYALKRKLGKGANGEVRLAIHRLTGLKKAIKIIPKGDVADCSKLDTEIKAMMMLQHKHIVQLEEVLESRDHVFFVMEICGGGNLYDYLDHQPLSEALARYYLRQIVSGVGYCHEMGIVHRDLSLMNLLLDNNANIKISDFGCAGIFQRGWDIFQTPLVGGLSHVAPEQIIGTAYSGEKMDTWSIGIILYNFLCGKSPFKAAMPQQYIDDIRHVRYQVPEGVSDTAADLISRLLVLEPQKRLSCEQIAQHPWMREKICGAPLSNRFMVPVDEENLAGAKSRKQQRKRVGNVLKRVGIHVLPLNDDVKDKTIVRCQYPEKDLKFSFVLRKKSSNSSQWMAEFSLKEGESMNFLALMPKIKNALQKNKRKKIRRTRAVSISSSSSSSSSTSSSDSSTSSSTSSGSSSSEEDEDDRRSRGSYKSSRNSSFVRSAAPSAPASDSESSSEDSSSSSDKERTPSKKQERREHRKRIDKHGSVSSRSSATKEDAKADRKLKTHDSHSALSRSGSFKRAEVKEKHNDDAHDDSHESGRSGSHRSSSHRRSRRNSRSKSQTRESNSVKLESSSKRKSTRIRKSESSDDMASQVHAHTKSPKHNHTHSTMSDDKRSRSLSKKDKNNEKSKRRDEKRTGSLFV